MLPSANLSAGDKLQQLLARFEQAWQAGSRPSIEDHLTDASLDRCALLRQLVLTDLEYRLRAGDAVRVEEYVQRFPELAEDAATLVELIALEYRQRQLLGPQPAPTLAEYLQRFPQHRAQLLATPLYDSPETERHSVGDGSAGVTLPALEGRYRVDRFLAKGGMGEVYRILDADFDRPLALKVLQQQALGQPHLEERFLREARLTGQLQHPGIPAVQEMGRLSDGRPYFIMKLVQGRDLRALLRERCSPQDQQSYYLGVFEQICRTVAYAHAQSIIHRDLKPSNIMVGAFGEVQVMDWGLAKAVGSGQWAVGSADVGASVPACSTIEHVGTRHVADAASVAGDVIGTPAYMAPEQARGEVEQLDRTCDVFGLGGILCELLTGKPPFATGNRLEDQRRSMKGDLSEVFARLEGCGADAELIALAQRCLAAERRDRPPHAEAVARSAAAHQERVRERLRQAEVARAAAEVRAGEERKRREVERQKRRVTLALAASVLVLFSVAAAGGWYLMRQQEEQERQELLQQQRTELLVGQTKHEQELILAEQKKLTVKHALEQVRQLQAKALFRQAKNTLAQSLGLLSGATDKGLHAQVKAAERDLLFVERLDRIRQEKSLIVDGKVNRAAAPTAYAAAFKDHGLDMVAGDERALVHAVVNSALGEELVAALDDWFSEEPDAALRSRLCRLTSKVTGHAWREEIPEAWNKQSRFEELLAKVPPEQMTTALLVGLSWRLERLGGDGVGLLERAKLQHPADFWVWFQLGSLYDFRGKEYARQAAGACAGALAIRPDSFVAWYHLGVALEASNDLPGAIAAYRAAIRLDPKEAKAHHNLGVALQASNDLPGAIVSYKEAIRLDPKLAKAHNNLGIALAASNDLPRAIAAYKEAIRLDHKSAEAHNNLGIALAASNDLPGAIAALKEAIRLDHKLAPAHNELGLALKASNDLPGAIAAHKEAIRLDPKLAAAHNNLGTALQASNDLVGAIAAYKEAIRLDPKLAKAHSNLGVALQASNDLPGAIAALKEAIRLDPKLAMAHNNLGLALAASNDLPAAIAAFKAAIRLEPKLATAHLNLGAAFFNHKEYLYSFKSYQAAMAARPALAANHASGLRLFGALAAVMAVAADSANEAGKLTPDEKIAFRQQALDWLKADLAAWTKLLQADAKSVALARQRLKFVQNRPELASVRDEQELAKLPAAQRQGWQQFWADVAALLREAEKAVDSKK
jgi:tetratricopeptide (TPR) repeat protein